MKSPTIYNLQHHPAAKLCEGDVHVKIGSGWYPARPVGYPGLRHRLRAAWLVLTGRADAVIWPGGQ